MRKIDKDGLILCELQATVFENSIDKMDSSSEIFIRRFMKSKIVRKFDDGSVLGTVKYTRNEMYWIGYIYRYFAITYELTSAQVYKMVKPRELRNVFLPYHTMDPSQAIERVLEAKGIFNDENMELKRQYEIFKRVRDGDTD